MDFTTKVDHNILALNHFLILISSHPGAPRKSYNYFGSKLSCFASIFIRTIGKAKVILKSIMPLTNSSQWLVHKCNGPNLEVSLGTLRAHKARRSILSYASYIVYTYAPVKNSFSVPKTKNVLFWSIESFNLRLVSFPTFRLIWSLPFTQHSKTPF